MLGRTNDFRQLKRSLYIVAADVESTEAVCFGAPGFDHVPISKAIQASTSSPGIYVPVTIDGRYYVDGTLRKGLHASVAFEDGADLVFAVNPQVPIDASSAVRAGTMGPGDLTRSGMPNLLSQMFRTINLRSMVFVCVGIDWKTSSAPSVPACTVRCCPFMWQKAARNGLRKESWRRALIMCRSCSVRRCRGREERAPQRIHSGLSALAGHRI